MISRDFEHDGKSVSVVAMVAGFVTESLAYTVLSPWTIYVLVSTIIRWQVLSWSDLTISSVPMMVLLYCYETWMLQWMIDYAEGRPHMAMVMNVDKVKREDNSTVAKTKKKNMWWWLYCCLKPGVVNGLWMHVLVHVVGMPIDKQPVNVWSTLLHSVWRVPLFELGLDLAFYLTHRWWHRNTRLYVWVHKQHHVHPWADADQGHGHGHLVTYDSYNLSWSEALWVGACYGVGLLLLHCCSFVCLPSFAPSDPFGGWATWTWAYCGKLDLLELSLMLSYVSYIEMWGHAGSTYDRVVKVAWRILPESLGITMEAAGHNLHHEQARYNFSKRFVVWDHAFGTFHKPLVAGSDSGSPPSQSPP